MISAVNHTKVRRRRVQLYSISKSLPCIRWALYYCGHPGSSFYLVECYGTILVILRNLGSGAVLIVGLVDLELRDHDLQLGIG